MRRVSRVDVVVAVAFVAAAVVEAVVLHRSVPGLLALNATGALWLGALAVRRQRPLTTLTVICGAAVLGTALASTWWPDASDGGGVWLFAVMLAAYSVGAHSRGRALLAGALLPLALALAADLPTLRGWPLVSGVVFITGFIGLVPTAVGRLVRTRHDRLQTLQAQHQTIARGIQAQQESAVLAERLRTAERLQPTLVQGLRELADTAEAGAAPDDVEIEARRLLGHTRTEVLALTAPIDDVPVATVAPADHLVVLRTAAQPWVAVAACAIAAGMAVESTQVLEPSGPEGVAIVLSLLVGVPVALTWWRPVAGAACALALAALLSRAMTPLDGSLSETALVLALAFAVGALSRRRTAVLGLLVCWAGQLVGVGTDDPLGEALILTMCWLGGLAVNEASRLVEQGHANNALIASQEAAGLQRAVVEERLRFARELHDALGSSLTVVVLQAGAARRLAVTSPERAREVMRDVAAAAREGLDSLSPAAVVDLRRVVERVRAAGLVVDAELADLDELGGDVRTLVHRVVQESLTNVLRHAPGSRARVVVQRRGDAVEVRVTNTGGSRVVVSPGSGRGLAGMRERVEAGAGQVGWQPTPDGGFEVAARLPLATVVEVTR